MTIGSIVLICFIAAFGGLISALSFVWAKDFESKFAIVVGVVCAVFTIAGCLGITLWQLNSESGKRALKTQQSNLNGGIVRTVKIFDMEGDEIAKYEGKFDVEHESGDNRIMFDDENGKRHVVYYTTGTVVVDEK